MSRYVLVLLLTVCLSASGCVGSRSWCARTAEKALYARDINAHVKYRAKYEAYCGR